MSQLSRDAKEIKKTLVDIWSKSLSGTCLGSEMDCGVSWFTWSKAEWKVVLHKDQTTPHLLGHGRDFEFYSECDGRCWRVSSRGRGHKVF